MIRVAKAMALTAYDLIADLSLVEDAKRELFGSRRKMITSQLLFRLSYIGWRKTLTKVGAFYKHEGKISSASIRKATK